VAKATLENNRKYCEIFFSIHSADITLVILPQIYHVVITRRVASYHVPKTGWIWYRMRSSTAKLDERIFTLHHHATRSRRSIYIAWTGTYTTGRHYAPALR